jgi:hypothetical protein
MNTIPKAILESIDTFLDEHADSLPDNLMDPDAINTFIENLDELVESFSAGRFEEVDYQAWLQSKEFERLIDLVDTDAFKIALEIASTVKDEGYSIEQKYFKYISDTYRGLKAPSSTEQIKEEIEPSLESLNTQPDSKPESKTSVEDITTENNPDQSEDDQKQKLRPLIEEGLRKAAPEISKPVPEKAAKTDEEGDEALPEEKSEKPSDNIATDEIEPVPESSKPEPENAAKTDKESGEALPEATSEKPSESVLETGEVKISAWKRAQQQAQAAKQKILLQQAATSSNSASEDKSNEEKPEHSVTGQNSNKGMSELEVLNQGDIPDSNSNESLTETKSDQDLSDKEQENLPPWKKAQMEAAKNIEEGKNQNLEPLLDKALKTATSMASSEISADELGREQFKTTSLSTSIGESSKNLVQTNDSQKVKTISPTAQRKPNLNETGVVSQKVNSVVSEAEKKQTEKESDPQKLTTPTSENIAQSTRKYTPSPKEQDTLFQRIEKEQAAQREQQGIAKEQGIKEEQLRVAKVHAQVKDQQVRDQEENGNTPEEIFKNAASRGSVVGAQVGGVVAGVIGGTASGIYHGISSIFKGRKEETLRTMTSEELISEEERKIVKLKDIITNVNFKYTDNYQNFQLYAQEGFSGFSKSIDFGESSESMKSIEFDFDKPNYLSRIGKQIQSKIKSGVDAVNLSEAISDEIENLHDFCDEYDDVKKSKKPSLSVLNGIFKATEITQRRANMLGELHSTLFSHIKDSAIDLTDEQLDTLSFNQKFVDDESKTLMEKAKDLLSSIKDKIMKIFEKGVGRDIDQDEMSNAHDNIKKVGSLR